MPSVCRRMIWTHLMIRPIGGCRGSSPSANTFGRSILQSLQIILRKSSSSSVAEDERVVRQFQDAQQDKYVNYSYKTKSNCCHVIDPHNQEGLRSDSTSSLQTRAKQLFNNSTAIFLPKGYPNSVGPGYISFVQASMASTVFSSAGGVLSMQALLYAIGLGAGSIPLAATINWILKDGLGQFGGVLFAGLVNNRFDSDPKRWRFLASVSLEVSNAIELCTPLVPSLFLPLAAIANVGKNISFLAASASRAAIHKTFAISENLADITAKTGSQNILCSMIGTSLGITAATFVGNHDLTTTMMIFSVLSAASMVCSYQSLKYVTINTISIGRLEKIVDQYFHSFSNVIASPDEITKYEKLFSVAIDQSLPEIQVGKPLSDVFQSVIDLEKAKLRFQHSKYLIHINVDNLTKLPKIHLIFEIDCSVEEVLHAFTVALLVRHELATTKNWTIDNCSALISKYIENGAHANSVNEFVAGMMNSKNWHIAVNVLEERIARIKWL